mgnify:CR=1 FL=1
MNLKIIVANSKNIIRKKYFTTKINMVGLN